MILRIRILLRSAGRLAKDGAAPETIPRLLDFIGERLHVFRWEGEIRSERGVVGYYQLSAMPSSVDLRRHLLKPEPGYFQLTGSFLVQSASPSSLQNVRTTLHDLGERIRMGERAGTFSEKRLGVEEIIGSFSLGVP